MSKDDFWHLLKPSFPCPDCKGGYRTFFYHNLQKEVEEICFWCNGSGVANDFYRGRNYDLFSQLAGVRNGYGFAGCYTGEGFMPIAEPKGLPKDVGYEVQEERERWGSDGHSESYFTVKELLEYPVDDLSTVKSGIMSIEVYNTWKEAQKNDPKAWPGSWFGGITGPGIKIVSEEDLPNKDATHVSGEWPTTYRECASHFWDVTVPELQKVADKLGDENVRIVIWFDN